MGVYLARDLVAMDHQVIVSSRRERPDADGVRYVRGNGLDLNFVKPLLTQERPDAVVDFMFYGSKQFSQHLETLLGGTRHYLFLSSYRVFSGETPLTERSPRLLDVVNDPEYLATDEYALAKAREEDMLRQSRGGDWTILRPSITYSKARFQFGCLEADTVCRRAAQGLSVVMPQEMFDRRTTMTWGRDVAKMISRLVLNLKAFGEDYNVVTSESRTWREIAEIYKKTIDLRVRECSMADYCRLCNPYQVRFDRMFDRVMDNRKVLEATGLQQSDLTPVEVGLARELAEFMRAPSYSSKEVARNAILDQLCGERLKCDDLLLSERVLCMRLRHPCINRMLHSCASVAKKFRMSS